MGSTTTVDTVRGVLAMPPVDGYRGGSLSVFPRYNALIDILPAELLRRIFTLGAEDDYPYADSPFLLKPLNQDPRAFRTTNFQLSVSGVSKRWREVALGTSSLWSTLHFRTPAHIDRAIAYLERCSASSRLLDIFVDTVAPSKHKPGFTLCRDEFDTVFDIITPHVKRWRAFHLKIRDNVCKAGARKYLSRCGPAPNLETLQLYHFEDYTTVDDLHEATYRTPVIVFDNVVPNIKNVSLIGVNLPWGVTTFLKNLHTLELALHPDNIRPFYQQWEQLFRDSPTLQRLFLHYSGPRMVMPNGDLAIWPSTKNIIHLPQLYELSLTDLDPDYLCSVMERLRLPEVKTLSLCLPEQEDSPEQDSTHFLELLAQGAPSTSDGVSTSLVAVSNPTNGGSSSSSSPLERNTVTLPSRPLPHLDKLEKLAVAELACSAESWRTFLRALTGLKVLEINFETLGDQLFEVLLEGDECITPHSDDSDSPERASPKNEGKGKANLFNGSNGAPCCVPPRRAFLPHLETIKITASGEQVSALIAYRESCGAAKVRRWLVKTSPTIREQDRVLDTLILEGWEGGEVKIETFEDDEPDEGEEEGDNDANDQETDDDDSDVNPDEGN